MARYEPRPRYALAGGEVERGYGALAERIIAGRSGVVAVDGPATADWPALAAGLAAALAQRGVPARIEPTTPFMADPTTIAERTLAGPLRADPVFARLYDGELADLMRATPRAEPLDGGVVILAGPGAALAPADAYWLVELPRRLAATAVKHGAAAPLGLAAGDADAARRLVFVDWPLFDRHGRSLLPRIDAYVDLSDPAAPRSLDGAILRASLRQLAGGAFRPLPTFAPGPWGGQWLRQALGIEADAPNLAWSYELIAPESSVLLGDEPALEVPLALVLAQAGREVLGAEIDDRFGGSFPIRFDYLDTLDGGHLSVHCHPREDYMREVFGWQYTQHESYYVMATTAGAYIFLGLHAGVDETAFAAAAKASLRDGQPLDVERFVQTHPAVEHGLYLIPAGTPHASSSGNVVLEISATPYLYSLRFYDWLREDLDGTFRPVQLRHAFANLDTARTGERVRSELLAAPRLLRAGDGHVEYVLADDAELFFAIHRHELQAGALVADATGGRFHVLNLVEGEEVIVETAAGSHRLAYAETLVVPASVGDYTVRAGGAPARLIKAFVRPPA